MSPVELNRQSVWNALVTATLVAGLAVVGAGVGFAALGAAGLALGVVITVALSATAARMPVDAIMRMLRATELSPWHAPELHAEVARLASRAGIAAPRIFLIPSPEPNALTSGGGRDAALAVKIGRASCRERV